MNISIPKRLNNGYCGRFAPSPSGDLHFGSLVTALASYLHAKSQHGLWLVRIEDIDKPREQLGAVKSILSTLDAFGLHWDNQVLYQSNQTELYLDVLAQLEQKKLSYFCQCTRNQIKQLGGYYLGHCRDKQFKADNSAIRLINSSPCYQYQDDIQGTVTLEKSLAEEDFIIHRRDGLFAYQLAVVVDDIFQGISHIVRGCDLLEPTGRQITLYQTLGFTCPTFAHVPLAITALGYKLSKQNKAPALNSAQPQPQLIQALNFLGQQPPAQLAQESTENIMAWAINSWRIDKVPKIQAISLK